MKNDKPTEIFKKQDVYSCIKMRDEILNRPEIVLLHFRRKMWYHVKKAPESWFLIDRIPVFREFGEKGKYFSGNFGKYHSFGKESKV